MKRLWSIPIALAYLYAVTVLTQYGYYSYFNIPTNFIDASISSNTIYTYSIATAAWQLIVSIPLLWKIVIGIAVAIASFISGIFFNNHKIIFVWIGTGLAGILLIGSFGLGGFIARDKKNFLILSPTCSITNQNVQYVIPDIYEGMAILVPIDPKNNNKIGNGFVLKDISTLPCGLEYSEIGRTTK